jgi:hypothetical protein
MAWLRCRWRKIGALIGLLCWRWRNTPIVIQGKNGFLSSIQYLATLAGGTFSRLVGSSIVPGIIDGADADAGSFMTLF